jgi:single stranded DNA-binding protein (ssb)
MYQQITIVGNLGKDPEMKFTPAGKATTSFSVATSHQYTQNGETVKETTWFRVQVWGNQAEACNKYLHKGSKVLVTGRLQADKATGGPRIWMNKNNEPKSSFEINASEVKFLDPAGAARAETPAGNDFPDDGIPF